VKYTLVAALFLLSLSSRAEYRVYQYYVKARNFQLQDSQAYLVTSSLDPQSYIAYHGGYDSLKLDLVRTWVCPGYTGRAHNDYQYCESPYKKLYVSTKKNPGEE